MNGTCPNAEIQSRFNLTILVFSSLPVHRENEVLNQTATSVYDISDFQISTGMSGNLEDYKAKMSLQQERSNPGNNCPMKYVTLSPDKRIISKNN